MGPRARRRLTIGAIGLGVVAAATAVFFVTRPPGHSTTTSGGGGVYLRWPITEKLTFGMTKQQVQRLVGKPTMTVRDETGLNCWQYRVNKTYRGFNKQNTLDAVRVCFFSGTYSVAHYEFNGKWDYHPEKIRV
jgi:outer membrane protein assembly factor BamE (lipoprotein component of BamABCDE complex)